MCKTIKNFFLYILCTPTLKPVTQLTELLEILTIAFQPFKLPTNSTLIYRNCFGYLKHFELILFIYN